MIGSLRLRLVAAVAVPMAAVAVFDAWSAFRAAEATARLVQERMLVGAARFIGEQVHLEEGVVQADVPPAALELFASPSRDHVFYRIASADHQTLAGYYDLAEPVRRLGAEQVQFYDTTLRDRQVHAVAFEQPVFSAPQKGPVLIQIGQTLDGRRALAREIWTASIGGHLAMLLLAVGVLWFSMRLWLRPLLDLRDQLARRAPGTLVPLDARGTPDELQPLVQVVNEYVARLDAHMSAHDRFIADASHQLRTPLTILNTQVSYAQQARTDGRATDQALQAIKQSVEHGIRLVNQLLTVARVRARRPSALLEVDLVHVVANVVEAHGTLAHQRGIDLGLDGGDAPLRVRADPVLLREMVSNLVDNAVRYGEPGGTVTATVASRGGEVLVEVVDDGPGIPVHARELVFQRFHRLDNSRSDGSGLGLSIVRDAALHCGAQVELDTPARQRGLLARLRFPAPQTLSASSSG